MTDTATATPPYALRRSALSRDEIVDSALALIHREGIDAVTMRRLADEIGVTPMALYHHITSKKELLDLVVDRIGDQIRIAHDGRLWTEQIRDYVTLWRDELHLYPGVAGYLLSQHAPPTMAWRVIDDAVSLLVEAGFEDGEATRAFAALVSFVLARCDQEERISNLAETGSELSTDQVRALIPNAHDNLDLERVGRYLHELSADEHFHYTLDRLLVGIDTTSR